MPHLNTEDEKIKVVNFLKNAAMDMACQTTVPNYVSGEEDLLSIAQLMTDVSAGKEEIIFPEKFGIKSKEEADVVFRKVANLTYTIYNYLIQGASLVLEYGTLENVKLEELAEMIDEL
jgi:hypothetical protein